ncbi:hypothetical protein PGT21_025936 [Puccinia graminis f. sp. tritici]|uniref:Golgi to ER traffic-protein n=1 Tax=Puccinia graminis f. sp. tritici TaxID=56615 RepID=A0A5B0PJ64_PUCGR|nr:hypothetical protein PGT21_025936 [Puccinia graminis f. sp. tritici]KAA1123437.1 hypothetical protein PGTUg99_008640 [Puccinia graminis f. sp. tritici]
MITGFPRALCNVLLLASQLPTSLIRLEVVAPLPPSDIERTLSGGLSTAPSLDSTHVDVPKTVHEVVNHEQKLKRESREELQPADGLAMDYGKLVKEPHQMKDNFSRSSSAHSSKLTEGQPESDVRRAIGMLKSAETNEEEAAPMSITSVVPDSNSEEGSPSIKQSANPVALNPKSDMCSDPGPLCGKNGMQNTENGEVQHGKQPQHHPVSNGFMEIENVGPRSPILGHPLPSSHDQLITDSQQYPHVDRNLQHYPSSYQPLVPNQSSVPLQLHYIDYLVPIIAYQVQRRIGYLPMAQNANPSGIPSIHDEAYAQSQTQASHSAYPSHFGQRSVDNLSGSSQDSTRTYGSGRFRGTKPPTRLIPPRLRRLNKDVGQQSTAPYQWVAKNQAGSATSNNFNMKEKHDERTSEDLHSESDSTSNEANPTPNLPKVSNNSLDGLVSMPKHDPMTSKPSLKMIDEILPGDRQAENVQTRSFFNKLDTISQVTSPRPKFVSKKYAETLEVTRKGQPTGLQSADSTCEARAHGTLSIGRTNKALNKQLPTPKGRSRVIHEPENASNEHAQVHKVTPSRLEKIVAGSKEVKEPSGFRKSQEPAVDLGNSNVIGLAPPTHIPAGSVLADEGSTNDPISLTKDKAQEPRTSVQQSPREEKPHPDLQSLAQTKISDGKTPEGEVVHPNKDVSITQEVGGRETLPDLRNRDGTPVPRDNKFAILDEIVHEASHVAEPKAAEKRVKKRKLHKGSTTSSHEMSGSDQVATASKKPLDPQVVVASTETSLGSKKNVIFNLWDKVPRPLVSIPSLSLFMSSKAKFFPNAVPHFPSFAQRISILNSIKSIKSKLSNVVGRVMRYKSPQVSAHSRQSPAKEIPLENSKTIKGKDSLDSNCSSTQRSPHVLSDKSPNSFKEFKTPQDVNPGGNLEVTPEGLSIPSNKNKRKGKELYHEHSATIESKPTYVKDYCQKYRGKHDEGEIELLETLGRLLQADQIGYNTIIKVNPSDSDYEFLRKFILEIHKEPTEVKQLKWLIGRIGKIEGRRRWEAVVRQYRQPEILRKWKEAQNTVALTAGLILDRALKISEPWPTFYDDQNEEYEWVINSIRGNPKNERLLFYILGIEELNHRLEARLIMKGKNGDLDNWLPRTELKIAYQQGYHTNHILLISNILQLGTRYFEPVEILGVALYHTEFRQLFNNWGSKRFGAWGPSAERIWLISDPKRAKIYKDRYENLKQIWKYQDLSPEYLLKLCADIRKSLDPNKRSERKNPFSKIESSEVWWNLSDMIEWQEYDMDLLTMVNIGIKLKIPQLRNLNLNEDDLIKGLNEKSIPEEKRLIMRKWFEDNSFSPYEGTLLGSWYPIDCKNPPILDEDPSMHYENSRSLLANFVPNFKKILSEVKDFLLSR